MSYKVEAEIVKKYENSVKYDLELLDNSGGTVVNQVMTLSNWQVEDGGLKDRFKQWANRRTPQEISKSDLSVQINQ